MFRFIILATLLVAAEGCGVPTSATVTQCTSASSARGSWRGVEVGACLRPTTDAGPGLVLMVFLENRGSTATRLFPRMALGEGVHVAITTVGDARQVHGRPGWEPGLFVSDPVGVRLGPGQLIGTTIELGCSAKECSAPYDLSQEGIYSVDVSYDPSCLSGECSDVLPAGWLNSGEPLLLEVTGQAIEPQGTNERP